MRNPMFQPQAATTAAAAAQAQAQQQATHLLAQQAHMARLQQARHGHVQVNNLQTFTYKNKTYK